MDSSLRLYNMMPYLEILSDDTKLTECPDITKSLIVIKAAEGGVDPYTLCTTNAADEPSKVHGSTLCYMFHPGRKNRC